MDWSTARHELSARRASRVTVRLEPVRTLLAEGLVTALIDRAMAVLTAAMMFLYRPTSGLIVLAALALYIALASRSIT
jgi:ABC-type bacteriocin/lantibiotic exporter with double-glycine peptidase domain